MNSTRRELLAAGAGAASLTALHLAMTSDAEADQQTGNDEGGKVYDAVWPNWVPRQVPTPQPTILFMDWRHI